MPASISAMLWVDVEANGGGRMPINETTRIFMFLCGLAVRVVPSYFSV